MASRSFLSASEMGTVRIQVIKKCLPSGIALIVEFSRPTYTSSAAGSQILFVWGSGLQDSFAGPPRGGSKYELHGVANHAAASQAHAPGAALLRPGRDCARLIWPLFSPPAP